MKLRPMAIRLATDGHPTSAPQFKVLVDCNVFQVSMAQAIIKPVAKMTSCLASTTDHDARHGARRWNIP